MLALGCDHGGYPLMKEVIKYLEDNKIAFKNFGTYSEASVDYPVPQIRMPFSHSPSATACATLFAYSG